MYKASLKDISMSPIKLGVATNVVRGENAHLALQQIGLVDKKGAYYIKKCLKSALAAAERENAKVEDLTVKKVWVTKGSSANTWRMRFGAKGRIKPYRRSRSNLFIELSDGSED